MNYLVPNLAPFPAPPLVPGQVYRDGPSRVVAVPQAAPAPGGFKRGRDYGSDQSFITELEEETFSFIWKLKIYGTIVATTHLMKSPLFKGGHGLNGPHTWQLMVVPKQRINGRNFLSVHAIFVESGDGPESLAALKIQFQFSLISPEGVLIKQGGGKSMSVCQIQPKGMLGFHNFMSTEEVRRRVVLAKDELIIHCRLWILGGIRHRPAEVLPTIKERGQARLSCDIKTLLEDSTLSDVTMTCGGTTFNVHKCVLSARSPVFKAMFQARMLETDPITLEINDFDPLIVKQMIDYIYSGDFKIEVECDLRDLAKIANVYGLPELKSDCEQSLVNHLKVEDAGSF